MIVEKPTGNIRLIRVKCGATISGQKIQHACGHVDDLGGYNMQQEWLISKKVGRVESDFKREWRDVEVVDE